jgi:hypothetical protein
MGASRCSRTVDSEGICRALEIVSQRGRIVLLHCVRGVRKLLQFFRRLDLQPTGNGGAEIATKDLREKSSGCCLDLFLRRDMGVSVRRVRHPVEVVTQSYRRVE